MVAEGPGVDVDELARIQSGAVPLVGGIRERLDPAVPGLLHAEDPVGPEHGVGAGFPVLSHWVASRLAVSRLAASWGPFPPPSSRSRTGTRFQKTIPVDLSPLQTWPPRASARRWVSQRGSWYPMAMWVRRVIQRLTPRWGFMLTAFRGSPLAESRRSFSQGQLALVREFYDPAGDGVLDALSGGLSIGRPPAPTPGG